MKYVECIKYSNVLLPVIFYMLTGVEVGLVKQEFFSLETWLPWRDIRATPTTASRPANSGLPASYAASSDEHQVMPLSSHGESEAGHLCEVMRKVRFVFLRMVPRASWIISRDTMSTPSVASSRSTMGGKPTKATATESLRLAPELVCKLSGQLVHVVAKHHATLG